MATRDILVLNTTASRAETQQSSDTVVIRGNSGEALSVENSSGTSILSVNTISSSTSITGDITASGDVKITGTGSFGRLEIAGDSSILGDVTIGGNINIGDSDTDSLTISADLTSNLIPNADSTFNLGSPTKNWKEGYIEELSSTNITASGDISGSGISTGSLSLLHIKNKIGVGLFVTQSRNGC